MFNSPYAKFVVAVIGAAVSAGLQFAAPGSPLFAVLTVVASVLTAVAVYFVPNAPKGQDTSGGAGV